MKWCIYGSRTYVNLGPRGCIGSQFFWYEAKVIITRVLQNFSLSLVPNQKIEVSSQYGTIKAKYPVMVDFVPRL